MFNSVEGKIVLEADDKVLRDIERRERARGGEIIGVTGIGYARRLVNRLAPGVSGQEAQVRRGVTQRDLECIVVGVGDGGIVIVVPEVRSQPLTRSVVNLSRCGGVNSLLAEGPAGRRSRRHFIRLAQPETKPGIAWIVGVHQKQMMRLRSNVAYAEHRSLAELPLDREEIVLGVWVRVPGHRSRHALLGSELRERRGRVWVLD